MGVTAVVPWTPGCPYRERSWRFVRAQLEAFGFEVIEGRSPDGPYNRAWAILDGAMRASNEIIVVHDADVVVPLGLAIHHLERGRSWAVPHGNVWRLTRESSAEYLDVGTYLPHMETEEIHRGNETGTCVLLRRESLDAAPPDVRFVGWGHEDDAWQCALRTMVGAPWRGSAPLHHLWHPPQPRQNRNFGSRANIDLARRYRHAKGSKRLMGRLLDGAAERFTPEVPSPPVTDSGGPS